MARGRRSYYTAGGTDPEVPKNWEARVDKDPFYRTMDILNGVFNKKIKLKPGKVNRTDLHTIEVNFGELKPSRISKVLREGADSDHSVFLLECGHEWEGRKITKNGIPKAIGEDYGMCGVCGADTIYRGFEHEWQHIIFKSDLAAMAIFCDQYAEQLLKQAPNLDKKELTQFIHKVINAFDDIRVNSLWEKVYPGSAMAIWDRWRYFVSRMDNINTSFLAYIFAVGFGIPTNPQGEFEPMRPVIERTVREVKYRGFNKMLLEVRVVLDRCMGALLAKMKPKVPPTMQPPPPPSLNLPPPSPSPGGAGQDQGPGDEGGKPSGEGEQSQGATNGNDEEADQDQQQGQEDGNRQEDSGGQEGQQAQNQDQEQAQNRQDDQQSSQDQGLAQVPSAQDVPATDQEREDALTKLMSDPVTLDEKEEHADPTDDDLERAMKSQYIRAMLNKIMHQDIKDVDALDAGQVGQPDADMQAQIDRLLNGIAEKNESSQLTDAARAKITIIEVTREGKGDKVLELDPRSKADIQRLRATFLRSMGKQKAKRSSTGTAVDIESLIQYLGDHQDPDIFENQDVNQGFAYSVVCDMSGSMTGSFPVVCEAVEMLKQALEFPFVIGTLWGFRGGQPIGPSTFNSIGDVWMYRYAQDVNWYTGTTPFRAFPGPNGVFEVPVRCGGITPMNAAINVATSHLWRKMPSGMAKRMFLLTDGSPVHTKVTGARIPEFMLRQFVANEIKKARQHGIEVYTIVIGERAIDDERCLQMFGQRKFWTRVGQDRVGLSLLTLVLRNFNRYLRRG